MERPKCQHQLDPNLVKAYATDFCRVKVLRDATRQQVENFVAHLADWAEKEIIHNEQQAALGFGCCAASLALSWKCQLLEPCSIRGCTTVPARFVIELSDDEKRNNIDFTIPKK